MELITNYLKQYGWQYEEVADDILVTSFSGENGQVYPFLIIQKEDICSFQAQFKRKAGAATGDCRPYLLALRMNYSWPFLKIGLNDTMEEFVLSLDLFVDQCPYSVFENSLETFVNGVVLCTDALEEWVVWESGES